MEEKTWSVYRHTFPNGDLYFGITSGQPKKRWDNGYGYKEQTRFFKRIIETGWSNITHEILDSGLSEDEAREEEQSLIQKETGRNADRVLNTIYGPPKGYVPESEWKLKGDTGLSRALKEMLSRSKGILTEQLENGDMKVSALVKLARSNGYDVLLVRRCAVDTEPPIRIEPEKIENIAG